MTIRLRWGKKAWDTEGLMCDYSLSAQTEFATQYSLWWNHPGDDELELDEENVWHNYDAVVAKYPGVVSGQGPYWECTYGPEGQDGIVLGSGTEKQMKELALSDYTGRLARATGLDAYRLENMHDWHMD